MDRVMLQGYECLAVVPFRVDRTVSFHLVAAMLLSRISCQPCTLLSRCHPWEYQVAQELGIHEFRNIHGKPLFFH